MEKLAIIGASYLQAPLILKAKKLGYEVHVFAPERKEIVSDIIDYFYSIDIRKKDIILEKCKKIHVSGICSIASDLAAITVNYVANKLDLVGNSCECSYVSTNKYAMKNAFKNNNIPSPKSILICKKKELFIHSFDYPLIVKPTDRSGSRGVTKVKNANELVNAYEKAKRVSFEKKVLIEEYVDGDEYSIECISQNGFHQFIAITKKYTTGSPFFIETGHTEPGMINSEIEDKIKKIVFETLNAVGCENGASHTEIKINKQGIFVIEVGCRMGGDMIGSHLVPLSTGYDFVNSVIDVSVGKQISEVIVDRKSFSGVKYIFNREDYSQYLNLLKTNPNLIVSHDISNITDEIIEDSSKRFGYYIVCSKNKSDIDMVFKT